MEPQKDTLLQKKRLSSDTDFYNNVFKKTERIVSVILYILSETEKDERIETYMTSIKDRSMRVHESSLETLRLQDHQVRKGLIDFQYTLVELQSTLQVAETIGVVAPEVSHLVIEQIDAVMRYINNHYLTTTGISVESLTEVSVSKNDDAKAAPKRTSPTSSSTGGGTPAPSRQRRVNIPAGDISSDAYLVYSQLTDRAERIKTVLEAKPQATVKDIAEVITDVSEKTIQRELNSLIEKGQVVREGERRWSRYSVSK